MDLDFNSTWTLDLDLGLGLTRTWTWIVTIKFKEFVTLQVMLILILQCLRFDHYLGIPYSHDMCPCRVCFPGNRTCHDTCRPETVSCPLYRDETIIQQPADLLHLDHLYTREALKFIKVSRKIVLYLDNVGQVLDLGQPFEGQEEPLIWTLSW